MKKVHVIIGRTLEERVQEELKNKLAGIAASTEMTVINNFKSKKLVNMLPDVPVSVVNHSLLSGNDWREIEENNRKFFKENKVKNLMVIGFNMLSSIKYGENKSFEDFLQYYVNEPQYKMKFMMTLKMYAMLVFIKNAIDCGCMVYHFVIDPQEIDFGEVLKTDKVVRLYKLKREGCLFAPSYEMKLMKIRYLSTYSRKYDFLFYCGAQTEDRDYIVEKKSELESIPNSDVKVITKANNKEKVSQREYYNLLKQARFTLVIPSYDKTTFSIVRFLEAVANGCLPLVWKDCCLEEVKNTYKTLYDIIQRFLLVDDLGDIKGKMEMLGEEGRRKAIMLILKSKELNAVMNEEVMRKRYDKLLK